MQELFLKQLFGPLEEYKAKNTYTQKGCPPTFLQLVKGLAFNSPKTKLKELVKGSFENSKYLLCPLLLGLN